MLHRYTLVCALVVAATSSFATDLTFANLGLADGQAISDTYGSYAAGPDPTYGVGIEGYTPNIGTTYFTGDSTTVANDPPHFYYHGSYGDISNVGTTDQGSDAASITLTPDPGYGVTLDSFHMATDLSTYTALFIDVVDSSNHVLWSVGPGGYTLAGSGHAEFDPNISSTGPLTLRFGDGTDLGISDVRFGQFRPAGTPEPFTLGLGFVGVGIAMRRLRSRRS